MTSYSDLNTARVKVKVTGCGVAHTTLLRIVSGATEAQAYDAQDRLCAVYSLLATQLPSDFSALGATWAPGGSNVFQPLTLSGDWAGIVGGRAPVRRDAAKNWKVTGNDLSGNTTSITLWYLDDAGELDTSNDYRRVAAEGTIVEDIINALILPTPLLVGRSGQILDFKPYANIALAAYWQRELRK